jgi:hypothetical protein
MKATLLFAVAGAMTFATTTFAAAQAQMPRQASTPGASETIQAPTVQPNPPAPIPELTPLFRLGDVPVVVWAPVEPPYDSNANRNNAANPLWYAATNTATW